MSNGPRSALNWVMSRVRRSGLLGAEAAATSNAYALVAVVPHGRMLQGVLDLAGAGTIRAVVDDGARGAFLRKNGQGQGQGGSNATEGEGNGGGDFLLSEAALAHAYLERGHATGKVLLKVHGEDEHPKKRPEK